MSDPTPGAIVHAEFASSDLPASRKFLEQVFGWKFTKEAADGAGEYWSYSTGSGIGGGLTRPGTGASPGSLNYVLVESVAAAVAKIRQRGGTIVVDRQEIPKVGWFAVFQAPGGIAMAVFEPLRPGP